MNSSKIGIKHIVSHQVNSVVVEEAKIRLLDAKIKNPDPLVVLLNYLYVSRKEHFMFIEQRGKSPPVKRLNRK